MNSLSSGALVVCLLLVSSVFGHSLVFAQSAPPGAQIDLRGALLAEPGVQQVHTRMLLHQQWQREREYERDKIGLAGPITGLLIGVGLLGASVDLTLQPNERRVGGLVLLAVSLPIVVV